MATIIPERWKENVVGATLTSIKVGGEIRYFSRPRSLHELQKDIQAIQSLTLPFRILGGGSNLVYADNGFKGLVIQPAFSGSRVLTVAEATPYLQIKTDSGTGRYKAEGDEFLNLQDSTENTGEYAYVELEAGMPWGQAVLWTLRQNLIGLHWYARIPCNVGGAVYNNIHGESHLLSESVVAVRALLSSEFDLREYTPDDLAFGYDTSRFHTSGEIITSCVLRLAQATPENAKNAQAQYIQWTQAKNTVQPIAPNCGSVFQNITPEEAAQHGETAVAAAYYIDQKCKLRGTKVGGMQLYEGHGNFIVNTGTGTQADFIELVEHIRQKVQATCGIWLMPEVECMTETGEKHIWA